MLFRDFIATSNGRLQSSTHKSKTLQNTNSKPLGQSRISLETPGVRKTTELNSRRLHDTVDLGDRRNLNPARSHPIRELDRRFKTSEFKRPHTSDINRRRGIA